MLISADVLNNRNGRASGKPIVFVIRRDGTMQAACLSLNVHFYVVDPLKCDIYILM